MNVSEDTQFGIDKETNSIIHISEVPNEKKGLKCNCVCPCCKSILVANKGEKNRPYFSHYNKEVCSGALETALHLFAKEVISSNRRLGLPDLFLKYNKLEDVFFTRSQTGFIEYLDIQYTQISSNENNYIEHQIVKNGFIDFDKVEIEQSYEGIIPDLICYKNEKPLFVEIYVTHEVDANKLTRLQDLNISTIEINLGKDIKDFYNFNREEVIDLIVSKTYNKKWLYHRKLENYKKKLIEDQLKLRDLYLKKNETLLEHKKQRIVKRLQELLQEKENSEDEVLIFPEKDGPLLEEMGIKEYLPLHLDYPIRADFIFNFERYLWQTYIFYYHIFKNKKNTVSIKSIVKWMKEQELSVDYDFYYTKDVETLLRTENLLDELLNQLSLQTIPNFSYILKEYFSNLEQLGFVKCINPASHCYYREYLILRKCI